MKFPSLHNFRIPRRNLIFAAILLLLASLATSYYSHEVPSINSDVKALEHYVQKQQKDFNELTKDTLLMRKLVLDKESLEEFKQVAKKEYGFFLYAETLSDQGELLFWNNQKVLPSANDSSLSNGEYFQRLSNGYYVVEKKKIIVPGLSNHILAYGVIPVFYNYRTESAYLPQRFAHSETAAKKISISDVKTQYAVHSIHKKPLFFVARKAHTPELAADPITLLLRIGGLILLLSYIQFLSENITRRYGAVKGTIALALMLVTIRTLLFLFSNFFYLRQFKLFDPAVYGTNWLNRSLGDLLMNAAVFCWVSVFAWHNMGPIKKVPSFLRGKRIYVAAVLALLFLILSTFELANMVRRLVADSKI